MNNPFKEILENEQLPEIIRKRVIDDIDLINLSLQVADLFVVKTPEVISDFFDLATDERSEPNLTEEDPTPPDYE